MSAGLIARSASSWACPSLHSSRTSAGAAARIAKVIGVSPAELATIEGLVESDLALRRARGSFLFPEGNFA